MVTLSFAAPTLYAETSTEADFAACNAEARAAVKAGTAAPIRKDHTRAETARRAQAAAVQSIDSIISDRSDRQLVGMASEG
jgi:hypothetical protein